MTKLALAPPLPPVLIRPPLPLHVGKPLVRENELKMPEKAGEKIGFLGWTRFYMTMLPKIPRFISNRPSVVDKRIKTVRSGQKNLYIISSPPPEHPSV
jgi:hypothetical protein